MDNRSVGIDGAQSFLALLKQERRTTSMPVMIETAMKAMSTPNETGEKQ